MRQENLNLQNTIVGIFLLSFGQISSADVEPKKWEISPTDQQVGFRAIGKPSALRIQGESPQKNLKGSFAWNGSELSGEATFELKSLETGIALRDRHMKDKYLEVEKYPEAKILLKMNSSAELKKILDTSAAVAPPHEIPFTATLKLHGVEKPVQGKAVLTRNAEGIAVAPHFSVKLTDFGIQVPSFAGITVADSVDIDLSFLARSKSEAPISVTSTASK